LFAGLFTDYLASVFHAEFVEFGGVFGDEFVDVGQSSEGTNVVLDEDVGGRLDFIGPPPFLVDGFEVEHVFVDETEILFDLPSPLAVGLLLPQHDFRVFFRGDLNSVFEEVIGVGDLGGGEGVGEDVGLEHAGAESAAIREE
jgi:hypothetical protein